VWCLIQVIVTCVGEDICKQTFCLCEENDISCAGSNIEELVLTSASFSPSIISLHLTNMASIKIEMDTFNGQEEFKEFNIENVKKVVLAEKMYSDEEIAGHITHFKLENIEDLQLEGSDTFTNFPQCAQVEIRNVKLKSIPEKGLKLFSDTMIISGCNIGQMEKESIYSDSQIFQFIHNKVGLIKKKAFSGSNNKFNFSDNEVENVESNAISVAFLSGDISRNTFHKLSGTPLRDIGPDPICMPDPDAYSYDDPDSPVTIEYNIVGSPSLVFQDNYFQQFSLQVLDFPGVRNVPLGSLVIDNNKVKCDCETIKELAILADFDHLPNVSQYQVFDKSNQIFKKEFYGSSLCETDEGEFIRLKRFARSRLAVAGDTDHLSFICHDKQIETDWIP